MSEQRLIAAIRRNAREEIRVTLGEWKGVSVFGIRAWFQSSNGTMRPSKDGLILRAACCRIWRAHWQLRSVRPEPAGYYSSRARSAARRPGSVVVRHVRIHHWLMRSAAWKSLSCDARAVFIELYALFDGSNNGRMFLSIRDAASRVNVGKTTAAAALMQLVDRGFVRPNVKGAFTLKQRHATSWVLTEFEHAGQLATKDFMGWQPEPKNHNAVRPKGQMVRVEAQMGGA